MMECSQLFDVLLNEPGVDAYTRIFEPEAYGILCESYQPQTFQEAAQRIIKAVNDNQTIFIKEMGFAAKQYLFQGELASVTMQQDAITIFIVRDPHAALISLYSKRPELFSVLDEWMSYEDLWNLFESLRDQSLNRPYVILAEELASNPNHILTHLFAHCRLPFSSTYLHWAAVPQHDSSYYHWNNETAYFWCDRVYSVQALVN